MHDWLKSHRDEAQKRLDLFAQRGVTIIEPGTVHIKVFQKAEVLLAKEELMKLLGNLDRGNPQYRKEMQLELAQALRRVHPVYTRTRDPELLALLQNAEKVLK